jgi:heme exporter protein B
MLPGMTAESAVPASSSLGARRPGWLRYVGLVFRKDLTIELESGEITTTSGYFALLVVIISSMAFYGGPETRRLVAAGAIWLAIAFSAVLALGQTWQRERDQGALRGLLVSPLPRSALFVGKMAGLLMFLGVVECVVVPTAAVLFALDLVRDGPTLAIISALAVPGIAATSTLFGVMTVRTRARGVLLAIVLFPLLAPTLLAAVSATRSALDGVPLGELAGHLKLLTAFDMLFVFGGLGLFGLLVED